MKRARRHVRMDAAAAALDARCLRTSANSGDRTAWCVCNDARTRSRFYHRVNAITTVRGREQRKTGRKPHRRVVDQALRLHIARAQPLQTTTSSSIALGCLFFYGVEFLFGADHSRCENTCQHLCLEANLAVSRVGVECASICRFVTYCVDGRVQFIEREPEIDDFRALH